MRPEDRIRLQHMIDASQEALGFAAGRTRDDLDSDRKLVLALVKAIEIFTMQKKNYPCGFFMLVQRTNPSSIYTFKEPLWNISAIPHIDIALQKLLWQ